jgi:hypothetical protein
MAGVVGVLQVLIDSASWTGGSDEAQRLGTPVCCGMEATRSLKKSAGLQRSDAFFGASVRLTLVIPLLAGTLGRDNGVVRLVSGWDGE